jgi:hypothetical protein
MGLSLISLSLASTPSHILAVVSFKRSARGGCGACGAAYLTPTVVLLPVLTGASGGMKLAVPGMANIGTIVEMGTGSSV